MSVARHGHRARRRDRVGRRLVDVAIRLHHVRPRQPAAVENRRGVQLGSAELRHGHLQARLTVNE